MELDTFKTAWNTTPNPTKTTQELQTMLAENKHPVLKQIRKQLAIEITGWTIFLLCYYTMFDGDAKPLWVHLLLVASVILPLTHNLLGYRVNKYLINGSTIKASLQSYLAQLKRYAFVSIATRVVFIIGLLCFLTYNISFNTHKYISLGIIALVFMGQLVYLGSIWMKRMRGLEMTIGDFEV